VPLPEGEDVFERRHVGVRLAAFAARLTGAVSFAAVEKAVRDELAELGPAAVADNIVHALAGWELAAQAAGQAKERAAAPVGAASSPDWVELTAEGTEHSAPVVHGEATSLEVRTGLWRVFRPVIDLDHCTKCGICMAYCPDGVIGADRDGWPVIDYEHCKGCMVCVVQCPTHTIAAVTETSARAQEAEKAKT
jgi:pyruvate ferredoxin oxidoreductase gamma subunit